MKKVENSEHEQSPHDSELRKAITQQKTQPIGVPKKIAL